jgi:hypothetical protein
LAAAVAAILAHTIVILRFFIAMHHSSEVIANPAAQRFSQHEVLMASFKI